MDIKDLKKNINGGMIILPLYFKYGEKDNSFLCEQYIKGICDKLHMEPVYVESFQEIHDLDPLFTPNNNLYIYKTDNLETLQKARIKNYIVVTSKIAKGLDVNTIDFPKLENWQIEAYVQSTLDGFDEESTKKLCSLCQYNIYRIDKECDKIKMFAPGNRKNIFNQLINEGNFNDLITLNIFNFTSALIKRDLNSMKTVLQDLVHIDVEGTGVITILHKNFKNIIDIKFNPSTSAESLGLKPNQYNAIKWNCSKYTPEQLIHIYKFLTGLDAKIKNGELQFSEYGEEGNKHLINNNHLVDYLTTHMLNFTH